MSSLLDVHEADLHLVQQYIDNGVNVNYFHPAQEEHNNDVYMPYLTRSHNCSFIVGSNGLYCCFFKQIELRDIAHAKTNDKSFEVQINNTFLVIILI